MGRKCSICTHSQRDEIDKALLNGTPYRDIAKSYGTSEASLSRHKNNHLTEAIAKAKAAARASGIEIVKRREVKELEHALDVVGQLMEINTACRQVLTEALESKDGGDMVLKAADRVLKQIEFQSELLGELDRGTTVNVLVSQEWTEARAVLVQALQPYPEARAAVAAALSEIEGNGHRN